MVSNGSGALNATFYQAPVSHFDPEDVDRVFATIATVGDDLSTPAATDVALTIPDTNSITAQFALIRREIS